MMIDMNKCAPDFGTRIYYKIDHRVETQKRNDEIEDICTDDIENGIADTRGNGDIDRRMMYFV
jgi:hypothetical protein